MLPISPNFYGNTFTLRVTKNYPKLEAHRQVGSGEYMAKTLGEQIRRLRQARHMTMKQLADALGYSLDYIWRIETNRARPSGKIMQALADYFGANLLLDVPELQTAFRMRAKSQKALEYGHVTRIALLLVRTLIFMCLCLRSHKAFYGLTDNVRNAAPLTECDKS